MKFSLTHGTRPIRLNEATFNVMFRIRHGNIGALVIKVREDTLEITLEHFHDHGFIQMEERNGIWECPLCGQTIALKPASLHSISTKYLVLSTIDKDGNQAFKDLEKEGGDVA